ncbi:MAG: PilZ domain-containing protein [Candidatus Omnitrophica bacterium]|nr:PilZ domain-containing protein [Candidatus Omnitrophota bacterium]
MTRERRGFARLYVGVEGTYRQLQAGNEMKVLVQDISIAGVRFIANELLKRDSVLFFALNIPDIDLPITAEGKVIWQRQFSSSFFDTGMEFTKLEDGSRQELAKYIEKALGRVAEHRQYVRANLSTMVSYRLMDGSNAENTCLTVDISPTGLKVFMKSAPEENTLMHMSFTIPDEPEPILAHGKIMWKKFKDERFFEAGIEFTEINDRNIEKISRYIERTLGIEW